MFLPKTNLFTVLFTRQTLWCLQPYREMVDKVITPKQQALKLNKTDLIITVLFALPDHIFENGGSFLSR